MNESQRVVVISMDWTEEAKYWVGEFFEGLPDEDDEDGSDAMHTVTTLNFQDLTVMTREWLKGEDVFNDMGDLDGTV